MASFLKKIGDRQKQRHRVAEDPVLRRLQMEQQAKAVAYATVESARITIQPVLTDMCNALAAIYIRVILYGIMKLDAETIEYKFFKGYKDYCTSVDEDRITPEQIIKHVIRGNEPDCNPTLHWTDYKLDKLDIQAYGKLLPKYDLINQAKQVERNLKLWGAAYANAMFQRLEVIAVNALCDFLHWGQIKCRFFVWLFRSLQKSTKSDIYYWLDFIRKQGIQYKSKDLRLFCRSESTWTLALRID